MNHPKSFKEMRQVQKFTISKKSHNFNFTLMQISENDYLIRFCKDKTKIVDFLLMGKFWICLICCFRLYHYFYLALFNQDFLRRCYPHLQVNGMQNWRGLKFDIQKTISSAPYWMNPYQYKTELISKSF